MNRTSQIEGTAAESSPVQLKARRLHVRTNFFWALAGNTVNAASQWAIIVILARMGGVSMVGQYSLGLAIVAPIFLLASLNLRSVQITDIEERFQFADYFSTRLVTTIAAFLASLGIAAMGHYSVQTMVVIIGIAAMKALEATSEVIHGRWHQRERLDGIARSLSMRGVGSLAIISGVVYAGGSIVLAVAGCCLVSGAVFVFYDRPGLAVIGDFRGALLSPLRDAWGNRNREILRKNLKEMMQLAGPLGVVLMFVSLNGSLCRYWLAHYHGEREVGFFSAISYIAIAANTAVMALGQASGPGMARSCVNGDAKGYLGQMLRLAVFGILIGLGGIALAVFLGKEVMRLFYGRLYVSQAEAFQWLMIGAALSFLANCAGYSLSSARYIKEQLPMHVAVGAAISIAAWWWVPDRGVLGAAYAQTAGYALQLLISLVMLERVYSRIGGRTGATTDVIADGNWSET